MEEKSVKRIADELKANVEKVIVGKEEIVSLLILSLITGGHVLLEDMP